jgi:hypothetical protein
MVVGLGFHRPRELLGHLKSNRKYGNDTSEYKLYAERNLKQIKCEEYVLPLGTESFYLSHLISKNIKI